MRPFLNKERSKSGAKDAPNASRGRERLVPREAFGVRASLAPLLTILFLAVIPNSFSQGPEQWVSGPGYRFRALHPPPGSAGFSLLPPSQTRITFTNLLSDERAMNNNNLLNGSGVALGDYDGDGWCDIYFCSLDGASALYRNLGGWVFQDVTEAAGVGRVRQASTGAVFADVNGDGFLDLLVTSCAEGNIEFINDGKGHFTRVLLPQGVASRTGSTSMALADADGDGDLDLYLVNYAESAILRSGAAFSTRMANGKPEVVGRYAQRLKYIDGKLVEYGEPDVFYLNDGAGTFTPVSWTGGTFMDERGFALTSPPWDMGLSVMFRDMNEDGAPDLYVCNDFQTPDRCWINDGKGRFRAIPPLALRSSTVFAMGVDIADINRDGHDDFFVADMLSRFHALRMTQSDGNDPIILPIGAVDDRPQYRKNSMYLNRGDGTYADIAGISGLLASDWSWCPVFLDVDLDGYEDLLVGNGHPHDIQDLDTTEGIKARGPQPRTATRSNLLEFVQLQTPNYAFKNLGNLRFQEVGQKWGFDSKAVSHGIALGDLDNDGDLDVVVNCLNAPPLIYRNNSAAGRIAVSLKGAGKNHAGIGAKIVLRGGPVEQSQQIICGGRYLSGDQAMRIFATGAATNRFSLEVTWRSGQISRLQDLLPNHHYEVSESSAIRESRVIPPDIPPMFADRSDLLKHTHHETAFDDFALQPLLPRRFSQLGPGLGWIDLNGDGHDDLVIGAGRGGAVSVYLAGGTGTFRPAQVPSASSGSPDDITAIASWSSGGGRAGFLAGIASWENPTNHPSFFSARLDGDSIVEEFTSSAAAGIGPIAVADMDGDGDLDIFAGGRIVHSQYPRSPSSLIFRSENDKLVLDRENSALFAGIGMVSDAVFSDLDGDGFPELILACEWGPIRVFHNDAGRYREQTVELGLASRIGWWSSVTTADLDEDGRMDIIAGNWGLNSAYNWAPMSSFHIFYDDAPDHSHVRLLEAYDDPEFSKVMPWRDMRMLETEFPGLREVFRTHRAFSTASVPDLMAAVKIKPTELHANTLSSVLLLNRGRSFESRVLPEEAQWTPVFGLAPGDFDGDGHIDLFVAQNFFAVRPDDHRLDAGRGLLMLGDGKGNLNPVPGQRSGLLIYGEQRGCAASDFNEDGRLDLVVAQNGAPTRLFENRTSQPGLRIRLAGPPGNPSGLGAILRVTCGGREGPACELHGGGGYWSQASSCVIAATGPGAAELAVRWPGGKATHGAIPAGAKEIKAGIDGTVSAIRE